MIYDARLEGHPQRIVWRWELWMALSAWSNAQDWSQNQSFQSYPAYFRYFLPACDHDFVDEMRDSYVSSFLASRLLMTKTTLQELLGQTTLWRNQVVLACNTDDCFAGHPWFTINVLSMYTVFQRGRQTQKAGLDLRDCWFTDDGVWQLDEYWQTSLPQTRCHLGHGQDCIWP